MANILNKIPQMDLGKAKNIVMIVVVVLVIYVIVKFGGSLVTEIEGIFGIAPPNPTVTAASQAAINTNTSSANPSSPFSPQMYNNNPDASTLDYATLKSMADSIAGSVSVLPNFLSPADAQVGLAAIKQCNNQVDVSNLVVVFQQLYGKDLYDYMSKNYSSNSGVIGMQQIINFVNALPTI